jgi:hypothetical protein
VTHAPGLSHANKHELAAHVEAAGAHVAHFIPDHTLLVVGPPDALAALHQQAHPHIVWTVRAGAGRVHQGRTACGVCGAPTHVPPFLPPASAGRARAAAEIGSRVGSAAASAALAAR